MSDNTETVPQTVEPTPTPEPAPELVAQVDAQQPEPEPEEKKDPGWVKPAIDRLTREKHEARREAERHRAENEALRKLLEGKGGDTPPPPASPPEDAVERRARELVEQREVQTNQRRLIESGVKDFGETDWSNKATIVHNLGGTSNDAFMRAIVSIPNGHKVIAELADKPDRLVAILDMKPIEMAAELGSLAAELGTPRSPPRRVSAAPAPGNPVSGGRAVPEPTLYDTDKLSMREWAALYDKQYARGRRA